MTTITLQTTQVQELSDQELEHDNGGFFWFLFIPAIKIFVTVAAMATAGHFAAERTNKSVKALGSSDIFAEVAGETVGLVV